MQAIMSNHSLECIFDLEMLLEGGETRTRGYKSLEMLLEDGETRTRDCKNLEIKNFMYRHRLARLGSISSRFLSPRSLPHITQDHRARLVSSNRELFTYYQHISHFFRNSLYVYTQGILRCLLGFWPLGQNPAGANWNV